MMGIKKTSMKWMPGPIFIVLKQGFQPYCLTLPLTFQRQVFSWLRPCQHIEAEWRICVVKLTIIGSDNGLSPGRHQAIIWTNAWILLIGPLEINFIEILIGIQTFSFKIMHLKMLSAKWRPFCLGLNVLKYKQLGATDTIGVCKVWEKENKQKTH